MIFPFLLRTFRLTTSQICGKAEGADMYAKTMKADVEENEMNVVVSKP